MSTIKLENIQTRTGSGTITIGASGETVEIPSGVTITNNGTATGFGKVLQVVNVTYSTTTSSSSNVYADTGLSASITPTSASNKILVLVNHNGCRKDTNNTSLMVILLRGATQISGIEGAGGNTNSSATNVFGGIGITYLDSPATTSSTTYKTQLKSGANNATVYVNDVNSGGSTQSTITLMEISA